MTEEQISIDGFPDTFRLWDCRLDLQIRPTKPRHFWTLFWGYDIFFNGVPFFKVLLGANILIWIALWVYVT